MPPDDELLSDPNITFMPPEDRLVHPENTKEVICGICLSLLIDPMQCINGHLFCAECIRVSISQREHCPQCRCRLTMESLSRSLFVKQFISNLLIHCQYHYLPPLHDDEPIHIDEGGCNGQFKLSELEQHEKTCEFSFIRCPYTFSKSLQDFHLVRKCKWEQHKLQCELRPSTCQFCHICIPWNTLQNHESKCPQYPMTCEKCKKDIMLGEMESHLNVECGYQTVTCPFVSHGCPAMLLRKDVHDHVAKNSVDHLMLLQASHDNQIKQQRLKFEKALEINHKEILHLRKQLQQKETKFIIQWRIPGFQKFRKRKYLQSDTFSIFDFDWFIGMYTFGDSPESKDFLSIYMFVDSSTLPKGRSIALDYGLKVVNHTNPNNTVVKYFTMVFPVKDGQGWGDRKAVSREQILNGSGFLDKDDVLLIEVEIKVLNVKWRI